MPKTNSSDWALQYSDTRGSTRMLISLPQPMLGDVHAVAHAQGVSASHVVRRAITIELERVAKATSLQLVGLAS